MRFKKWTTRNIIVGLIVFLSVVGVSGVVYYQTSQKTQQLRIMAIMNAVGNLTVK